jgi:hypothetical protein
VSIAAFHLPAEINVRENWVHKTQDKKKTSKKTEGAIKNGQSRETGNIGHTRHRMKTNKKIK